MGASLDSKIPVTAVSNAAEAVCTIAASEDIAAGDYVIVDSAWLKLSGTVARVKSYAGTSLTLEGVDTTDTQQFPAGSGGGSIQKVESWVVIPQITAFESSGGEQNFANVEFLDDDQQRQIPTSKSAQTVSITIADDPAAQHNAVLKKADASRAIRPLLLALPNGSKILYNGYVSFNPTPTLTKGNIMTVKASVALVARPTRYET
ncbi:phage tail protein [Herbaspirillum seropedicae]|uniref:phage tail protein n=1 Tax=Herbaspirillum seropedicae TaxID=964 RepID=UPI00286688CC|nr:phage tail protein [Herbaspirillum seropedicae]MDR6394630.1 hypothetical protein [Herbaspirillum seropedicae]